MIVLIFILLWSVYVLNNKNRCNGENLTSSITESKKYQGNLNHIWVSVRTCLPAPSNKLSSFPTFADFLALLNKSLILPSLSNLQNILVVAQKFGEVILKLSLSCYHTVEIEIASPEWYVIVLDFNLYLAHLCV